MRLTGLDLLFWAAGFVANLRAALCSLVSPPGPGFPLLDSAHHAERWANHCSVFGAALCNQEQLLLYLLVADRAGYDATTLCRLRDRLSRFPAAGRVGTRPANQFRLADGPEPIGSFCSDLAGKSAGANVDPSFATKGNLFAAALLSELFVAMMALSINAGLPWKTHVAKIAQGLGAYSLITVLIESGHSYFGAGRELPTFTALSHVRMAAYLGCVTYWMINLWRDERPARRMTEEMRGKMFTLQTRLEYYLRDLRAREK